MSSTVQTMLILLSTQALASGTPGPNWMLIIRNSIHSRKAALATVAGVVLAILCMATIGMFGGSALLAFTPKLFSGLQIVCGLYLAYLGLRFILSSFRSDKLSWQGPADTSLRSALTMGFVTSVTNPKVIAFYTSIFAATGAFRLSVQNKVNALVLMTLVSCALNSTVALTLSHHLVRDKLIIFRHWSQRAIGTVLIVLSAYMLVGSI